MLKRCLLLGTALAFPQPFANTHAGNTFWIAPLPAGMSLPLTLTQFEAITTWVQVRGVGSLGETGSSTNIVTYDTWDLTVMQKGKGMTDAGSPDLEVSRLPADPGQLAMNAAAKNRGAQYLFKKVGSDAITVDGDPSVFYNAGIVTGPRRPNGRNEDFDLAVYTLGFNQEEVVSSPS